MTRREEFFYWLKTRRWDLEVFVTCAGNAAAPEVGWPSAASCSDKDVFYSKVFDLLENELNRKAAIAVFQAWANKFQAHAVYFRALVDQFANQTGMGIDLDAAVDACPPPKKRAQGSRERIAPEEQSSGQDDVRSERGSPMVVSSEPTEESLPQQVIGGKVFICYARNDKGWLEQLTDHLKPLESAEMLEVWDDRRVPPGDEWEDSIESAISESCVAVLLMSDAFLASNFIRTEELPHILRAQSQGKLRILPLHLEPSTVNTVLYAFADPETGDEQKVLLTKFQGLNDPDCPLSELAGHKRKKAIVKAALEILNASEVKGTPSEDEPIHPQLLFDKLAPRKELCKTFFRFAQQQDFVFALGGAGSGLETFCEQFKTSRENNTVYNSDLNLEIYNLIHAARKSRTKAWEKLQTGSLDRIHLKLKCLLATLAYSAYQALNQRHGDAPLEGIVPPRYAGDHVGFADKYFANSQAMGGAEQSKIVEHFFDSIQEMAEACAVDNVIVFMPWLTLSRWFENEAAEDVKRLAAEFWHALGDFARPSKQRSKPFFASGSNQVEESSPFAKYDKVCLIVACSQLPFGHSSHQIALVQKSVWPVPSLNTEDVVYLLGKIGTEWENEDIAEEVLKLTDGIPWFIRLLLSYVQAYKKHASNDRSGTESTEALLTKSAEAAEQSLESGGDGVPDPAGCFIKRHVEKVKDALGNGESTDSLIEEKWYGPSKEVARGCDNVPQRVEAFVGSGLVQLREPPAEPSGSPPDIGCFLQYPTVYFSSAKRLPLALYRAVTGKDAYPTVQ